MTDQTAASTPAPTETDADLDAQEAAELAKLEKLQAERAARAAKMKATLAPTPAPTVTEPVAPAPTQAAPVAEGVKLATRRWYATGKTKEVGMKFDPAWAAPKPNVHSEFVLLKGILSEAEDTAAAAGGAGLTDAIAKYGVEQKTFAASAPTVAAAT